jgi:hypothetical protein
MEEIMETLQAKRSGNADVNLKLSKTVCMKYFDGMSAEQMATVVEQALAAWFEGEAGKTVAGSDNDGHNEIRKNS